MFTAVIPAEMGWTFRKVERDISIDKEGYFQHIGFPEVKVKELKIYELKNIKTDDEIYLQNELDYHLAQYYMPKKTVRIYAKSYSEIPQYIGKALISESAFLVDFPIYPARAFMVGYDSYEIVSIK